MRPEIPRRTLGRDGLTVSAIGLGCMGMSEFYGPADEATNLAVLDHAIDIGVNFLDTADMYGVGPVSAATRGCLRRCSRGAAMKWCSPPSSGTFVPRTASSSESTADRST